MRTLALVQNQSEMAHYGYADCRALFDEFGYKPILYTAQNIERLSNDLLTRNFDSVVLGSNALNDKTIREVVYSNGFASNLKQFLLDGNGLVVLHQLRIAQQAGRGDTDGLLSFLPVRYPIRLSVRPKEESATHGQLSESDGAARHFSLVYPQQVALNDVNTRSVSGTSLKGLYWHYLEHVNEVEWDTVVHDIDAGGKRSLVTVTKETEPYRIVISALPLDWQRQADFLGNLCLFATEGSHRTAIYGGQDVQADPTFAYLLETLRSRKFPFRHYAVHEQEQLRKNIETGAHSVLLMSAETRLHDLETELGKKVSDALQAGRLRMLGVDWQDGLKRLFMIGKERDALRQLESLLIQYTVDLGKGYIDGSFFSTVESLQLIYDLGITHSAILFTPESLNAVLTETEDHDRGGSYDEVFHPTCGLLWLRATCFGPKDSRTQQTAQWIRDRLQKHMLRERVLALHTLTLVGLVTDEERQDLHAVLESQTQQNQLSELDIIFYLQVSVSEKLQRAAADYLRRLLPLQSKADGIWIDLATTATAVQAVLEAKKIGVQIDQRAFYDALHRAVSFIHFSRSRGEHSGLYSWDSKASTSLRCLKALVSFEETIDQPIHEVGETLMSLSRTAARNTVTEKALLLVQQLKLEHAAMSDTLRNATTHSKETLAELEKSKNLFREQVTQQKKEIAKLQKENDKLLGRNYVEIGLFWFVIPPLFVLAAAGFFSMGKLFMNLPTDAPKAIGELFSMVFSEWYLGVIGASVMTYWGLMSHFAKKRLGAASSDSKEE